MNEMNEIYQTWKEMLVGARALRRLCTGQQFHVTTHDIELNFSVSLSFQVSPSRLDLKTPIFVHVPLTFLPGVTQTRRFSRKYFQTPVKMQLIKVVVINK